MRDAAIYHKRAAECRELAEHSTNPDHRSTWRELELLWMRLAAESERRDGAQAAPAGEGTVFFAYSELSHAGSPPTGSGDRQLASQNGKQSGAPSGKAPDPK